MRWLMVTLVLFGCSGEASPSGEGTGDGPEGPRPTSRVPRRQQEEGLERCGVVLERMESPEAAPSFARLMRECSGMYARRGCRDALAADTFSRDAIAAACRQDYCEGLRPQPSFCTQEMPTDSEFLEHYARFSRMVLRRDLRRVMDQEGADEIADLFADLIEAQAGRQ